MLQLLRFSSTSELENISLSFPNAHHMRIVWCSASFNWNNVETGANFQFTIGGNVISIPAGQYDIDSLCSAIQAKLITELSDGSATCVYNTDLNRIVITTTASNAITVVGSAMARLTGLAVAGASTSHTGTNSPNLSLGDIYVNLTNWNIGRENQTNKGFLCVIPKSAMNSVPVYSIYDFINIPVINQTYSNYNVSLTNEYGLTMSGVEASIMLAFV